MSNIMYSKIYLNFFKILIASLKLPGIAEKYVHFTKHNKIYNM